MDLPFTPIELTAIDPARNIHRRWRVAAYRDLFGTLVVETCWGRIGAGGRRLVTAFPHEAAASAHIRSLLARRAGAVRCGAVRRIGVGYR